MPQDDARPRLAQGNRRLDELAVLQGTGLGADDAGHREPRDAAHRQENHPDVLSEDHRAKDDDERQRERAHDVDHPHGEVLEASADFGRHDAVDDTDEQRDGRGDQADRDGDHTALQQAREQVAPQEVGPQPMGGARGHRAQREVLRLVVRQQVQGRQEGRAEAEGGDADQEPQGDDRGAISLEALPAGFGRGGGVGEGGAHRRSRAVRGSRAAFARSATRLRQSKATA